MDRIQKLRAADFYSSQPDLALLSAIERDDIPVIAEVVAAANNVNARGKDLMTPLFWALMKEKKGAFKKLLQIGADPNLSLKDDLSVMSVAAEANDPEWLQYALLHGGDPNLKVGNQEPLISRAITAYRKANVELLIKKGANLNLQDENKNTPMKVAANLNRYDLVYLLLEAGADPEIPNTWNKTVVDTINRSRVDPNHELYSWRARVISWLQERNIKTNLKQK